MEGLQTITQAGNNVEDSTEALGPAMKEHFPAEKKQAEDIVAEKVVPAVNAAPDPIPMPKIRSPYECNRFEWLVEGTESWGNWKTSVGLLTSFRDRAGFPVCVSSPSS